MALVQCAASAAKTAGVFFGQGPSSKVSTISPSRRKSCALKCSKPNPGPPVVSISTTREITESHRDYLDTTWPRAAPEVERVRPPGLAAAVGGVGVGTCAGGSLPGCFQQQWSAESSALPRARKVAVPRSRPLGKRLAPPGSLSLRAPAPLWTPPAQVRVKPSERKIAATQLRQPLPQTTRSQARTLSLQAA